MGELALVLFLVSLAALVVLTAAEHRIKRRWTL
jgi:hypothetical protein